MNSGNEPEKASPLQFPCSFPIKVVGRHENDFEALVVGLVCGHVGAVPAPGVRSRTSSKGRFLSVTVTVVAESREQLDDIYRTLTACEQVLFVL